MKSKNHVYTMLLVIVTVVLVLACRMGSTSQQTTPAVTDTQVEATIAATPDIATTDAPPLSPSTPESDPNPPVALPFTDSFDNGLTGAWRVITGDPVISNGKLGSARSEEVILEIGNRALRDYTIEFTVSDDEWGWGGYDTALYLLLTPTLQVELYDADLSTRIKWQSFKDNAWSEVTRTELPSSIVTQFRVVVSGNKYQVFANGQIASELIYGAARETGAPLVVRIKGSGLWLDDFVLH